MKPRQKGSFHLAGVGFSKSEGAVVRRLRTLCVAIQFCSVLWLQSMLNSGQTSCNAHGMLLGVVPLVGRENKVWRNQLSSKPLNRRAAPECTSLKAVESCDQVLAASLSCGLFQFVKISFKEWYCPVDP